MVVRGGAAVHRGVTPHESRHRNPGVSPRVALVSARGARGLDEDMPPLVAAFAAAGAAGGGRRTGTTREVEWARFDLALLRSAWDYTERIGEFLAWVQRAPQPSRSC